MASPGIEPGSGASETLILSIVLRGRDCQKSNFLVERRKNNGKPLKLTDFIPVFPPVMYLGESYVEPGRKITGVLFQ